MRSGSLILACLSALTVPVGTLHTQQAPVSAPRANVRAIGAPRVPLPPEAASAGVSRFSFIVYGDTRGRRDGVNEQYEHSLIVESMLRTIAAQATRPDPVRFVLQTGDAVVDGRQAAQWNVSFVNLIHRITTEGGVPYFLAPGNHDVTSAADLAAPGRQVGLKNYLDALAQLIPPDGATRRLTGYPTYAFGYGNTFVIAFDSNIADDSVQFAWVKAQLEGLDRKRYVNVVAFFHHPVFSSGPHGGAIVERATAALRARYMPLFRQQHVKLLLAGHDHVFEHWIERYRDGDGQSRRIDQIVTGGGGAPLYSYQGEPDLRPYIAAAGADSVQLTHIARPGVQPGDNPYHYVVVHVDGAQLWLEVIGVDWGRDFQPYRSARAALADTVAPPVSVTPESPLARATQLVVVTTSGWDSTTGELHRFVRTAVDSSWRRAGEAVPIVVGKTGLAWGVGFDHLAQQGELGGPLKREGDGRSPAGIFPLGKAFGFAPADSMKWVHLSYLPLTPTIECVDDGASLHYNAVVDRSAVKTVDWNSSERMRQVEQYRLGVIVDYNAPPAIRARGSCIFLHIWAGPRAPTVGCTALDASALARLVAWLDPRARPAIVQLPAAVYARVREDWRLPPLKPR